MEDIIIDHPNFEKLPGLLAEMMLELFAEGSGGFSQKESLAVEIIGTRRFMRMSDLAGMLHLPLTTASSMVDRLVANGILKRSRFEDERRIVAVSLTPEGQALWEKQRGRQIGWLKEMLGRLSEAEQSQLLALLEKLSN